MARLPRTRRSFNSIDELKAAADRGDAQALHELAAAHALGKGVKKDRSLAFHLWMAAAEAGDAIAMECLADVFRTGDVTQGKVTQIDLERAAEWYRKSAEAGNDAALFGLACIHQTRQDFQQAAAVFKESAYRYGKREALREYGMCLYHGNGVPQDVEHGRKLIAEAALMDEEYSKLGCAYIAQNYGVNVPMPATPEDRAKRKATLERFQFEALVRRAEEGDVDGQVELAYKYVFGGRQHEKNLDKALSWFQRAANAGDAEAQFEVGRVCDKPGAGIEESAKAFGWYKKAAEKGYLAAQREAGRCLFFGEGTGQDLKQAARFFDPAAQQRDIESMVFFGWMLREGHGVKKDAARGEALIAAALELDRNGIGVAKARLDSLTSASMAKKKNS